MIHASKPQPAFGSSKGWPYFPVVDNESSDLVMGTVRRKANKRERNRTIDASPIKPLPPEPIVVDHRQRSTNAKVRSKSRSPGRSIEDLHGQFYAGHPRGGGSSASRGSSRPCSHHGSRGHSPDNISESSASFHENELVEQQQQKVQRPVHQQPLQQPPRPPHHGFHHVHHSSSTSSSSAPQNVWNSPQYANRDSVRESWFSSGSSDHKGGHHRGHQGHHPSAVVHHAKVASSGGTSDASNKSIASSGGQQQTHFQHQRQKQTTHKQQTEAAAGQKMGSTKLTSSVTLPRSAQKQQHSILKQPRGQQPAAAPRSVSRAESGSSSSRTVSRSGSRTGLAKAGSATFLPKRSETPEGNRQLLAKPQA